MIEWNDWKSYGLFIPSASCCYTEILFGHNWDILFRFSTGKEIATPVHPFPCSSWRKFHSFRLLQNESWKFYDNVLGSFGIPFPFNGFECRGGQWNDAEPETGEVGLKIVKSATTSIPNEALMCRFGVCRGCTSFTCSKNICISHSKDEGRLLPYITLCYEHQPPSPAPFNLLQQLLFVL